MDFSTVVNILSGIVNYSLERKGSISPPTLDGQLSRMYSHVLALSAQLMICCSLFQVVYGKRTQKCKHTI